MATMMVITSVLVTRAASAQETPLPVGARVRVTLAPAAAGAHVVGRLERASHDSLGVKEPQSLRLRLANERDRINSPRRTA